jgi:uncharacterized protein
MITVNLATECYFIALSISGITFIALTLNVIKHRHKTNTPFGHGNNRQLQAAIRAHGNFSEQAPLSLILMGFVAYMDAHADVVFALALAFLFARFLHMSSILHFEQQEYPTLRYRIIAITTNIFVIAFCSGYILEEMVTNSIFAR